MLSATMWEGFDIHVRDVGSGPPVILLHSGGMSSDQWRRTSDFLGERNYRVILPDLSGAGRSASIREETPFGFLDDVAIMRKLVARVDLPVHLVGHSYGGLIALRAACEVPQMILTLTLYDPVVFGVLDIDLDADARKDLDHVWFGWGNDPAVQEKWLSNFVDYWSGVGAWNSLRDPVRREFIRVGWVVHEAARTLVSDRTPKEAYRGLGAPALLLTGDGSPLSVKRVVSRLVEILPNASQVTLKSAQHMGPVTHADVFNQLLFEHLQQIG